MSNNKDKIFFESFDLRFALSYDKITPQKTVTLLSGLFYSKHKGNYTYSEVEKIINEKTYGFGYIIRGEDEFLMFSVVYSKHIEYHFVNLSNNEEAADTGSLQATSQNVFSTVVKIILENLNHNKEIHILAEDRRVNLYSKIIDKTLKQYKVRWVVKETKKENTVSMIILKPKASSYLSEVFGLTERQT